MNNKNKSILELTLIIILFISSSYIIQENVGSLTTYLDNNYVGSLIYVILTVTAVVIAPISTIVLLLIMSNIYGWFLAGILSILGWTIGAAIAFTISRKYGKKLVKRIVSIKKIEEFENKIPEENIFLSIVLLRMTIPVDILSYALGLLSKVKFKTYILATLIGVTPFAFILAYLGTLPPNFQITAIILIGTILLINIIRKKSG